MITTQKQIYRGVAYKITPIFDSLHRPNKKQIGCLISFFSPLKSGNCLRFPHQTRLIGVSNRRAQELAIARIDEMME